jgi:serine/threonine protein kinase
VRHWYTPISATFQLNLMAHLSRWLTGEGLDLCRLSMCDVERFLTAGTRLGSYTIVSKLGDGGMGEVFRGTDTRLGREVAIKVLPAATATSPDALARFEREGRAIAALNHPNICTL